VTPLYYIRRARELGVGETLFQAKELAFGRASRLLSRIYDRHFRPAQDERSVLERSGFRSPNELLSHFKERSSPRFFFDRSRKPEDFRRCFSREAATIIEAGDRVLQHTFNLLGSGAIDLNEVTALSSLDTIRSNGSVVRMAQPSNYLPWQVDIKSGITWDRRTYYKDIKYGHVRGLDVKVPWELSRFHHLIVIGQAYHLTSREDYAVEFRRQLNDWIVTNPCRFGVNWSCTMEVGIRAVNWIWAFHFFLQSPQVDGAFLLKFLTALHNHATFIFHNLEFREAWVKGTRRRLNSNHYLGDLIGLLYISLLFPELKLTGYDKFAVRELETELLLETAEDGADYEHSTHYHQLVLEIFLSGFHLLRLNGYLPKPPIEERLIKMAQFVADYSRPDGSSPQIGDSDSGRLHPLSTRRADNHTFLPLIAAEVFSRPDLQCGPQDPEVWWWLGTSKETTVLSRSSASYPDSGFYVLRSNEVHVFVSAARVGMCGLGSHSHNDLLSFEYWSRGRAWIVDPGTYLYTPDPQARNLFRSTEYHNGVQIDREEINPLRTGQLFQMGDLAEVTVHQWSSAKDVDVLDVEHTGYLRSSVGVRHRRRFHLNKSLGKLVVCDSFEGNGGHRFNWRLHLHPSVTVTLEDRRVLMRANNAQLTLDLPNVSHCELQESWYSPSYGVRQSAQVLMFAATGDVPLMTSFSITAG
jgi:Heparinase II/III-like protein/Heparinase II/III N-terminus